MAKEITTKEFQKKWAQVVAKCWMDPAFKQKVLKKPNETLKEFGIEAPANTKFEVEENSDKVTYLVIPQKPEGELSEENLKKIAAAGNCCPVTGQGGCE